MKRGRKRRDLAASITAAALTTACVGGDGESVELILLPSVVQIDYEVADVLLDSMVGTLAFEDRCVWLIPNNPAERRSLVAWPMGTRYDDAADEVVHEENRFRVPADFVAVGLLPIADLDAAASEVALRCIGRSGTSTEVLVAVAPGIELVKR